MTDTTYRTATVESKIEPTKANPEERTINGETNVEPPFSEYEKKNGKPYAVDYFDLGSFWNTGELYTKEIETINTYVNHLINTGELNNTTTAVKNKMKSIEKMINVDPEDRKAARVGKVAAYIEFLIKADNIKKDSAKYGLV